MLPAAVGMPWQARKRHEGRRVVGVGADGPRREVGRLQVETPGWWKYAKLCNAGGAFQSGRDARFDAVPPVCTA